MNILYKKAELHSSSGGRRTDMYCINYVIKAGDTLYSLSRRFNVPVKAIMDANPLVNIYNLIVDSVICIPVSGPGNEYTNYTTYLVEDGDTLGSVLDKNNMNLADFVTLNELKDIYLLPGSTLKIPIVPGTESGVTL
jgi:LysM repeat protein